MKYDPTRRALYFPGRDAPSEDFGVNWERDQICAELSRLAYVPFEKGQLPKLTNALVKAGFSEPRCFNDDREDAQGFATLAPDATAYVAFRGTQINRPKDILRDLDAPPTPWSDGAWVHSGFWKTYASLREEIRKWLEETGHQQLVVTGHSLGAAMATLMAAEYPMADLATFGSPRVGNAAFAKLFSARSVRRYRDCTDGVPNLPPPIKYRHVTGFTYIDRHGKVHREAPDAGMRWRDQLLGRLSYLKHAWRQPRNVLFRSFADHAPINYVSAVLGRRDK